MPVRGVLPAGRLLTKRRRMITMERLPGLCRIQRDGTAEPEVRMPLENSPPPRNLVRTLLGYGLMIAATVALFFAIRWYGETLAAPDLSPAEPRGSNPAAATSHPLLHLLLALAAVIILGRMLGGVFTLLRQPPVIGEVLAGIFLGPSLLGQLAPDVAHFILPDSVAPALSIVAQLGVILYMFVVGLELNTGILHKQGHVTLAISHASIIVPFSLGALLAIWLYPLLSSGGYSFTAFALFLSVSMSITAFPVLARILTDRGLHKTDLGVMALACAAIDDVSAWCLLALVVGVARSQMVDALWVSLLTIGYIVFMFALVRPLVARALPRFCPAGLTPGAMGALLVGMLLSAVATEAIGVHAIFGAFLFGAVIPHDSRIAEQMTEKLAGLVTTLLLPAFFAFTGMRTQIGLVNGVEQWLICLAIIAVATLGKFGGTWGAARVMGLAQRDAASLGVLMNTRGLMELIVLNIGLDLGIISPTLFAMMVLMAIATTVATSPILHALVPDAAALPRAAQRAEAGVAG
jgi:Kef-type K+ transport system membrane component KefB